MSRMLRYARLPWILLVCAATPAWAQRLGGGKSPEISWARTILGLLFCLFVAALAILFIRAKGSAFRFPQLLSGMRAREQRMHVLETRRLSPHADLCLVECDGREYLLVLGEGHSRLLKDSDVQVPRGAA